MDYSKRLSPFLVVDSSIRRRYRKLIPTDLFKITAQHSIIRRQYSLLLLS